MSTSSTPTELPVSYDPTQQFLLSRGMREEHRKYCLERGGKGPWREEFRKFVDVTIADSIEETQPFFVRGSAEAFDYHNAVTAEGLQKFLRNWDKPGKAKLPTLHLADAFLRSAGHPAVNPTRAATSVVRTLGRSTAVQYHDPSQDLDSQALFFSNVCGLHQLRGLQVHVPGPVAPDTLLMWLQEVPGETFVICRVVVLPTKLDRSRFTRTVVDRSDWMEDHFVGFGVMSRQGLSCHMTSTLAKIPLYILIRSDENVDEEPATAAFVSYSSPGHIAEYQPLRRLTQTDLTEYFDNRAWVI